MAGGSKKSSPPTQALRGDPGYEHILELLGCGPYDVRPDHPVRLALTANGLDSMLGLFTISRSNLSSLTYVGQDGTASFLVVGHQNLLLMAPGFRTYFQIRESRAMTTADWLATTPDVFAEYRLGTDFEAYLNGSIPSTPSPAPAAAAIPTKTLIDAFKKSIKRDPSQFAAFSDARLWASWNLQFVATARAQDLQDVLDHKYVPTDPDSHAVFMAKNEYLYSVFVSKLLTDQGKTLVRKHAHDFDAQAIYAALVDHHTRSTHAELSSNTILTFLTTFKLGRDRWKGKTVTSFLTYYLEQIRLYDDMMVLGGRGTALTSDFKRTHLAAAVDEVPELRTVLVYQATLCSHLGTLPTFDEYFRLLADAATRYDHAQETRSAPSESSRRVVYAADSYFPAMYGMSDALLGDPGPYSDALHSADHTGFLGADEDDSPFGVDVPLSTITAYAAQRHSPSRGPRPPPDPSLRLPDPIYSRLTGAERQAWNRIGPDARRLILGLSSNSSPPADPRSLSTAGISSAAQRRVLLADQTDAAPPTSLLHPPPAPPGGAPDTTTDSTRLLAMLTDQHHPGDLRRLLSSSDGIPPVAPARGEDTVSRRINMAVTYEIANAKAARKHTGHQVALIDRGANGGLAGEDCRIIATSPDRFVNIEGIDRHQILNIPIVTCAVYTVSRNRGPVIAIFHQFAGIQTGPTILSAAQLEAHVNHVNDRSLRIDKQGQLITTNDGYEFPLHVRNGLPYLEIRRPTDREMADDMIPHVVMTSDTDWDPSILDGEFPLTGAEVHFNAQGYDNGTNFDAMGNYRKGTIVASARSLRDDPVLYHTVLPDDLLVTQDFDRPDDDDDIPWMVGKDVVDDFPGNRPPAKPPDKCPNVEPLDPLTCGNTNSDSQSVTVRLPSPHVATSHTSDPAALRPFFAFLPVEVVARTLAATTQLARVPTGETMKRFYRSPYPALNVPRRDEDLLTDVIYSDTPAIDDGSTSAAVFSGKKSHVMDVYGMKTDKQFVNTLEDVIRERGAPNRLLSDHAIALRSSRILDILRALCIGQWTSEPHRQNQNTMERRYQTAKRLTNVVMDRSGCPASCWLLCMQYVCTVLNCTACKSLGWKIPLTVLLGVTIDVSPLLRFHWYQPVFYSVDDASFPSDSKEALGYFVGIAPHCGHVMTFKILTQDTQRIIIRSQVRPADDPTRPNLRLTDLFDGEPPSRIFVRSKMDSNSNDDSPHLDKESGEIEHDVTPSMVHVDTSDLVGKTFLMDKHDDGTRHRARIVEMIKDHQYATQNSNEHTRFKLRVNEKYDEIMSYGEILDHINKDEEQEVLWRFKRISGHQGPLTAVDPNYNGSTYNVQVEWENGEVTFEPLSVIAADDPVTCAIYARDNDLLDKAGWKRFKRIANREKKLIRMANQAKLRSFRTAPRFKYGYELPKNYEHALFLDRRNGNTKWQDATKLEFDQLDEYDTFEDIGYGHNVRPPEGYKKVRVHLVFDVKHDGRHKVRCVADGHLTDIPVDSVYSGVVSLRGLRIMLFLAELNGLQIWATDVGNAYLEAQTQEKLYIVAGPEFGDRCGHILVIRKALYGLRSSGKRWHERFADCLRAEGFQPCKAEPDLWIRPSHNRSCYEMVAVYVDDLAIGMKDPEAFLKILQAKYKFKLKGSGPITFHLGCDFERDQHGVLCMSPKQYIDRIVAQYERMFGSKPRTNVSSPLEKNDHPETDESALLDEEGIQQYQSLIGSLQWAVSLGRIDVTTAVMTLSSFRAIPRRGHLDRAKRVVAYLYRFKHAKLRFRTHEPDMSGVPVPEYDWAESIYGKVKEDVPTDVPPPLGKAVVTVSYIDANLMHCLRTGRSVTGILHFLNSTPIDWYSKKMSTVETATYGAEFIAARTCVEQLVDLRTTLRYLGVPIRERSYMFGDNESVVNSSIQIDAKLHKRHNALSFHRVREAIASGHYVFTHIPGENNPADILSKHWGYSSVWHMLKVLMHVEGETMHEPGRSDKDNHDHGTATN